MRNRSITGALILIVLGVLFLLSNFGWLPHLGPLFAQWWPLILVIVGVSSTHSAQVVAPAKATPNPSIEGTASGLRPPAAPHVKR
jgi:Domain of unknown function (DUF5668)